MLCILVSAATRKTRMIHTRRIIFMIWYHLSSIYSLGCIYEIIHGHTYGCVYLVGQCILCVVFESVWVVHIQPIYNLS